MPRTDRILTDVTMVPPTLMAGIKSTGYKTKKSDRTLTGATLEIEILSQCGESTMKGFKPSPMNHGKGSVVGQLVPVEYNQLTVSDTVSIDEHANGYMGMLEYRNSARGHLMGLEEQSAMEGYLETMMQGTTLKQKAYGTLVSSEMHEETIEQLVSLPWRAVVLRFFEEEMRTTPKLHALIQMPYVRTELQLRFAWCMIGLTRGEYGSEERKRLKEEKVFLMTSVRDLMTQEGAAIACAKRRDALFFFRFMIEQMSVPALNTCVKMLKEGDERAKALLLLALLDMRQSKPMRVNMKEPVELEPMRKIEEIRRFSKKKLRLTKESMGALPKSSEYCGTIRKKSYSYVSGIIGMEYNPFLNEDICDCFFDYEQAVFLGFWTSSRPSGAGYLVGWTLAPMCKSRYPVHFVALDVKSTRTIMDQAFSVLKCVRLARISEKSYQLLSKIFSAVPERTKEELESILGKKFMGYASGNFRDFERQKQKVSTVTDYNAVDENDEFHRVMMEVKPLLEASESVIGGASCQHVMSFPAIACCKHGGSPGVVI